MTTPRFLPPEIGYRDEPKLTKEAKRRSLEKVEAIVDLMPGLYRWLRRAGRISWRQRRVEG